MSAMGRSVVYLIAKAPVPGTTKTRLCPPLEPLRAARLARAFLLDGLDVVRRAGVEARVMCRDTAERAALERVVAGRAPIAVQSGRGLGQALRSAFVQGLAANFSAVAVLGADSPTLPARFVREAFDALAAGADVALGPSTDGGYYLLAARAVHPTLFRDMIWSAPSVARITLERCLDAGLSVHLLPAWYDVDDVADLARLRAELHKSSGAAARHTSQELARQALLDLPFSARQYRAG
jgi:rSAM/selenodomain-associated transferase 1